MTKQTKTEKLKVGITQALELADDENTEQMGSWKSFKDLATSKILQAGKKAGLKFVKYHLDHRALGDEPQIEEIELEVKDAEKDK